MTEEEAAKLRAGVKRDYISHGKPATSDEVEFVANAPAIVDLLTAKLAEARRALKESEERGADA